ncbi:hypothetical protein Ocin01_07143 [Orchesella cincta]|uniref:Uncharacterized protein n=1 Tax=Orchesella cincta TaxID=48709 RepID=A0A1D2N2N7_ORCCI|nr:hypothetical protein Ocin01_07143 [Orchesella cincta]
MHENDDDKRRGRENKEIKMVEEDDDDDEEVLWCSGCTGGKGVCSQCVRSLNGDEEQQRRSSTSCSHKRRNSSRNKNKIEDTCESEEQMLSGLPSSSTSDGDNNCCPCPCPFPRSQSLAFENIPMTSIGGRETSTCATSGTSARHELLGCSRKQPYPHQGGLSSTRVRRHPLIPSKTIVVPPTSSSSLENLISLENKATSIACLHDARIICREKILASVPNKLSSTGVRILYLCDVGTGETDKTELDDGAYNPLWTMRGFTQTFHMWRENRRAQSVPLNAFLTYITLPCASIMKGESEILQIIKPFHE